MTIILIIMVIFCLIMGYLNPKIDKTSEGEILLWYGNKKRKYIKIWQN
mgnify:FL=1